MLHRFSRTELLIGPEGLAKLADKEVIVFGIGGVGAYTAEALVRAGVGNLTLVDDDDICLTNINRQLHALHSTIGKPKVEVMRERLLDINPKANITAVKIPYSEQTAESFNLAEYDYVVDAIDTVSAKIHLINKATELGRPVIGSMGAGNKLDVTKIKVGDLFSTSVCPLAKVMRKELRKRGIKALKVVYSTESPVEQYQAEADCRTNCICTNKDNIANCTKRRSIPGSISYIPSIFGLMIAGEVIKDLLS